MRKLTTVLVLLFAIPVLAQQLPQYTNYMVNPFLYNPAFSGSEDYLDAKTGYRHQWVGLPGAPRTFYASAHTALNHPHTAMTHKGDYHNWHSAGAIVTRDLAGATSKTAAYANYSYDIRLTEGKGFGINHTDGWMVSVGANLGFQSFKIERALLNPEEKGDPILLNTQFMNDFVPDAALGLLVYYHDVFYAGLAAQNIFMSRIDYVQSKNTDSPLVGTLARHYILSGGAKLEIDAKGIYIMPSLVVKYVNPAQPSIEAGARLDYMDKFFGGITYRHQDALSATVGLVYNYQYEFGYSYDLTTSRLNDYSSGSHEIYLGYRINPKWNDRIADPLFNKR